MPKRVGRYTVSLPNRPAVTGFAAVVGKKEGEGPLAKYVDFIYDDTTLGESSWEKAESHMQSDAVSRALESASLSASELDYIFAGDLLNQCIGSSYALKELDVPYIGLFGACSTMAESIALASIFVESRAANTCAAATSSHFCSAERQFRFPLEYGGQRTPSSQHTATAAGCAIIRDQGEGPYISNVTFGRMVDLGVKDINNMGSAMAPAAAATISDFLKDTGTNASDYDLILTGDLSLVGTKLLKDLLIRDQIDIKDKHADCGLLLYDIKKQDMHAGGSGCGCSAAVLCSYIFKNMRKGNLNEVLFVGTGALMSPVSIQQGDSIPSVAHLVHFSNSKGEA